jgi:hypothetical protein
MRIAAILVFAFMTYGCGGSDVGGRLQTGTWTCTFTSTSKIGCDPNSANSVSMPMTLDATGDLSCASQQINQGPIYEAAQDLYMWETGYLSGVADDHATGTMTYRYSAYVDGSNSCTVSGPMDCTI